MLLGQVLFTSAALAREGTTISLEADPAPFIMGGYGGHLKVNPSTLDHWVFGIGGAFSFDLPKFAVDINADNNDEGWQVRLRHGYGLFADYYFNPDNRGWQLGMQVLEQSFEIKKADIAGRERFTSLLTMTHFGYRWFPSGGSFYLHPWTGVGYTTRVDGSNQLGAQTYAISPLMSFATLHIGYEF